MRGAVVRIKEWPDGRATCGVNGLGFDELQTQEKTKLIMDSLPMLMVSLPTLMVNLLMAACRFTRSACRCPLDPTL